MSSLVYFVPAIVFFVVLPCIYGVYTKLSARLLRASDLRWKHGFLFGLLVCAASVAGRIVSFASGATLPLAVGIFVSLAAHLLLGGWFFSTRGTDAAGNALGWPGAVKLSALTFLLMGITAAILFGVAHALLGSIANTPP